jgi:hypothetical protein
MKKLAGRDFEDLLQCAIPVFEGLFPEPHNKIVLDLLFSLSTWHSLAKLRLHTDSTLDLLDSATQLLGNQLRIFKARTCTFYQTRELPSEVRKRQRKAIQKSKVIEPDASVPTAIGLVHIGSRQMPKQKEFNINTFKVHALGHYTSFIRQCGTTDSYSTQPVEHSYLYTCSRLLLITITGRIGASQIEELLCSHKQK